MLVCLFLSACAQSNSTSAAANSTHVIPSTPEITLDVKTLDPDNDSDFKGHLYFPKTKQATGHKVFIFDPNFNAWALYDENGTRLNTGKASGGKAYCPDISAPCRTTSGTFKIYSKGGADCISHTFPLETKGGAPMPYCMFFNGGLAVHGSSDIPNYNASHGCIRITPPVAKWLSEEHLDIGDTVIVLPYNKPGSAEKI